MCILVKWPPLSASDLVSPPLGMAWLLQARHSTQPLSLLCVMYKDPPPPHCSSIALSFPLHCIDCFVTSDVNLCLFFDCSLLIIVSQSCINYIDQQLCTDHWPLNLLIFIQYLGWLAEAFHLIHCFKIILWPHCSSAWTENVSFWGKLKVSIFFSIIISSSPLLIIMW